MKKIFIFLGFLFAVFLGSGLFLYQKNQQVKKQFDVSPQVSFHDEQGIKIASFKVEIASTSAQHQKGLMHREDLAEDQGMLFIYQKEQSLSFWMKNTLIPLDIIYIGQDKKVVSVSANVQPCKEDPCSGYPSKGKASYVLEINGGLAEEFEIEKGTEVKINLP